MKKLTTRQRQGIETKFKITRIATELFKNKGFNDVTIRDICMASSISVGTFYHHFASKEEIISTAYHQIDLLWDESISSYEKTDTIERILYLYEEAGDQITKVGWELASQSYQQLLISKKKYTFDRKRPIFREITQAIETGISEGIFVSNLDVFEMADSMMRASRGVIFDWCLKEGKYDIRKQMRHDILFILSNYFCD